VTEPVRRVGLNLMWLVPGVVGGSEEYTTRLLSALADAAPPRIEFIVFGNPLVFEAYPELGERYRCVTAPASGERKGLRVAAENTWLAVAARRHRLDLLHHLGGIMPFVRTCPSMLTVHDLQPLVMPEHFEAVKRVFAQVSIPTSARNALVIVTLAESTRDMLVERLRVDPRRVEVIPAGIRPPTAEELVAERALDVRERYDLGDAPFFLYPAITYPHKNHVFLLEAFGPVAHRHPETRLVLTGGSAQMEHAVRATIDRLDIGDNVHRPGRIPRRHLDALYQEATALVFPSRFEGFGIPLLEAMSRGCPVVAARATALPEVGGDAAVLLPLGDVEVWTRTLVDLLEDPDRRAAVSAAGRVRARQFDWTNVAERFGEVYQRVLAAPAGSPA
jgi:glycosyltransferase involved in cell wall biosynthesis